MWHKVATVSEVSSGSMKQVQVQGATILLANVDGDFFAMGDICTHEHCELSSGILDGSSVYCPCHGGQYDVTTGEVLAPPPPAPEPTYKVKVEGSDVFVEVR